MKSSKNPSLLYKSQRLSFECSTLLVESRSRRIFRRRYFSRIDLNRRSASVASRTQERKEKLAGIKTNRCEGNEKDSKGFGAKD